MTEREFIINSDSPQSIRSMEEAGYRELVRCKVCKHSKSYSNGKMFGCEFGNGLREPDWFCADGVREES